MQLKPVLRNLARTPRETLLAMLALGAGIGLTTTLFSIVKGVLWNDLPVPQVERIVRIEAAPDDLPGYRLQQTKLESVEGLVLTGTNSEIGGVSYRLQIAHVSPGFFDVLQVKPAMGSTTLGANDGRKIVLSHRLWQTSFHSNPAVLGSYIKVNGESVAVAGIMPAGFTFARSEDAWMGWEHSPAHAVSARGRGSVAFMLGPLKADATLDQARAELIGIAKRLHPATAAGPRVPDLTVSSFAEGNVKGEIRVLLTALLVCCFFVLMIACANVANLSLARAARRLHEFGLRSALGAKRGQLVSLLLTENLLIAGGGALAGVIFARAALDLFLGELQKEAALTGGMPASLNFEVDGLVLAFVSILTIATALASGVVPALRVTGMSLEHLIRGGGRSTTLRSGRFGKVLIQVQLAASVLLLIGTGVMGSIWAQMGSKVQYDPSKILSARIELPQTQFTTPERRGVFFQTLETELKASTMIEAAALSTAEHIERTSSTGVVLEGTRSDRASDAIPAKWQAVSPGFFEVFRSSLRGGRLLSNQDSAGSLPVAVVNQSFLRRNWSNSDPIGKRFRWTAPNGEVQWLTVVGVVEDMGSLKAVADANAAAFYVPLAQTDATEVGIVMRTRGEASAAIPAVREVLRNQTTVPLFQIHTAQQIMEMEAVGIRVPALLFAVCGISGLLLSAVGTYGVLSLSARQRTREMGIRLALGATPKVLFRSLMVQGSKQVMVGIGTGLILGLILTQVLSSLFSSLTWVFAINLVVAAVMAGVGLLSVALPALESARVEAQNALRE